MTSAANTEAEYGALVLRARGERGWTQGELARFANLSRRTVSRVETGSRPAPSTREALDDVLVLPVGDRPYGVANVALAAVGRLLRRLRTNQGIRMSDAAQSLQISTSQLSRLERGQAAPRLLFDVGEDGDYELRPNAWRSIYYERYRDEIADLASGDGSRGAFRRG